MADELDNVHQLARGLRDEEWERKKTQTSAELEEIGREIEEAGRQLRATVTELHREPRANLEPTEDELRYLIEVIPERDMEDRPEANSILNKMMHALAIESGPGGNFRGDTVA